MDEFDKHYYERILRDQAIAQHNRMSPSPEPPDYSEEGLMCIEVGE